MVQNQSEGLMQSESHELRHLRFARFDFHCSADSDFRLPMHKGATFRGGFGHLLRNFVCINRTLRDCSGCILIRNCLYAYIFETRVSADNVLKKGFETAPHPYILLPPTEDKTVFHKGDNFSFSLTLIGKAIEYLPYFIFIFQQVGERGIGRHDGKFTIVSVVNEHFGNEIEIFNNRSNTLSMSKLIVYSSENYFHLYRCIDNISPNQMTIRLITPLRIKTQGTLTDDFSFFEIMRLLMNRLYTLTYFHCGNVFDRDHRELLEMSKSVEITKKDLQWREWVRYSTRQKVDMKIGGIVGSFDIKGPLRPFLPFLKIGEYIHIGKLTSMGLGQFKIEV